MRILYFQDATPLGDRVRELLASQGHSLWVVRSSDVKVDLPGRVIEDGSVWNESAPPSDFEPQLLLIGTFPWRLPAEWIRAAPLALNLHSSLLPRWRGAHPEFWALRTGDAFSGVTLHHLTHGFDQGPIAAQRRFPLTDDECLGSLCEKMAAAAEQLTIELLERLATGTPIPAREQEEGVFPRAPTVRDQDLEIRHDATLAETRRLLRACFPYIKPWFIQDGIRWSVAPGGTPIRRALRDGEIRLSAVRAELSN